MRAVINLRIARAKLVPCQVKPSRDGSLEADVMSAAEAWRSLSHETMRRRVCEIDTHRTGH